MSTTTTYLGLTKPALAEAGWGTMLNTDLDVIDALFTTGPVLLVAKGGTGLATLTANRIPYGNGTSAFQSSAGLTFDGTTFKTTAAQFLGSAGSPAGQVYIRSNNATTIPLVVDAAASPASNAQEWRVNGTARAQINTYNGGTILTLMAFDNGTADGTNVVLQRNNNVTTPAAGYVVSVNLGGTGYNLWADTTGKWRTSTAAPTNANDISGTVVGDQTCWGPEIPDLAYKGKDILRQWDDPTQALDIVLATKIYDFRYNESSYLDADSHPAVFTSFVGFDRHDWFLKNVGRQQVPCLNEITVLGYHTLAIQALHARIALLEAYNDGCRRP